MLINYIHILIRSTLLVLCFSLSSLQSVSLSCIKNKYISAIENNMQQSCVCDFCNEIRYGSTIKTYKVKVRKKSLKKPKSNRNNRVVMIYMAADNDLKPFAANNIREMANVGSSEHVTILVHLDIRTTGNKKITQRYLIEKDQVFHVEPYNSTAQHIDSGNPSTLISFCEWAIKSYPADTYDIFFWNHGTGILEPLRGKIINPMDLFVLNPATHRFDLDRSIGFIDAIDCLNPQQRGVCWDNSTGNYLSNRKLDVALQTICTNCLNGKKFGIIGFDACLMSMVEVMTFIQKYADVMVGSEEVELGMGWKYDEIFSPFIKGPLDTVSFASHIVSAYHKRYHTITNDYTLSAVDLENIHSLERNIDQVSQLLIEGLEKQKNVIHHIIKESRSKLFCTYFDEPTYIDLHNLYKNLAYNISNAQIKSSLKNSLLIKLEQGIQLIDKIVIANTCGRNLKNAHGISIYFPERNIHSSYQESIFVKSNAWGALLSRFILG